MENKTTDDTQKELHPSLDDYNSSETSPNQKSSIPKGPVLQRKLFIGSLAPNTSEESFKTHFAQFGEIEESLIMRHNGRSRCFGFVTYTDRSSLQRVMNTSDHFIDGKRVTPQLAIPKQSVFEAARSRTNKLFVAGLNESITSEDLHKYFSAYGKVSEAIVKEERMSGKSRGFGFVTLADEQDVERIMAICDHQIKGFHIDIKKAEPRRDYNPYPPPHQSYPNYEMRQPYYGYESHGHPPYDHYGYPPQGPHDYYRNQPPHDMHDHYRYPPPQANYPHQPPQSHQPPMSGYTPPNSNPNPSMPYYSNISNTNPPPSHNQQATISPGYPAHNPSSSVPSVSNQYYSNLGNTSTSSSTTSSSTIPSSTGQYNYGPYRQQSYANQQRYHPYNYEQY